MSLPCMQLQQTSAKSSGLEIFKIKGTSKLLKNGKILWHQIVSEHVHTVIAVFQRLPVIYMYMHAAAVYS